MRRLLAVLALAGVLLVVAPAAPRASAHHDSHGHAGYLFAPWAAYEMNSRTATGQTIPIRVAYASFAWVLAYAQAYPAWNTAISPITGFDVYTNDSSGYMVTVNAGSDVNQCGYLAGGTTPAHGCLLAPFNFNGLSGSIYMYDPVFTDANHRISDLMHELGHVLYIAGEHYTLPGYGCSPPAIQSIMNHCLATAITDDDKADFQAAYRMIDAPDAAYGQLVSSATLRHFFEGSYFGGNGNTLHAEKQYWIDRATGGVSGTYQTYTAIPRVVSNTDDGAPNSADFSDLPPANGEWCFKIRGETGGIADPGLTFHWGPYARAYCVARSGAGSGVLAVSNRNDYAAFRIWNYSGSQINNVALMLAGTTTRVCDFGTVYNNSSSGACFWYTGNPSGYLDVWYNWTKNDTIGYDSR